MGRLIGLLMILALVLPPLLGIGGLIVAAEMIADFQTTIKTRTDAISYRLNQTETMINDVSARFDTLRSVADQVSNAARSAAQAVAADDFTIRSTVSLGDPGMSTTRRYLQNLYDALASLSSAISNTTTINQVPGQFGMAVTEAQGLSADLDHLSDSYRLPLLILGIAFVVWLLMLYVIAVYRWLRQGWRLLTGRALELIREW